MNAKELRIGNLIYNEYTKQVQEVYPEMITQLSRLGIENNMKPIPITEDWLLNFGFIKDKVGTEYYKEDFTIYLPYFFQYKDSVIDPLNHIHQLQNLYFSLTNKELKQ